MEATQAEVVVGEVWTDCCYDAAGGLAYDQDPHRQRIVDWCDATGGTSAAFDFTTKVSCGEAGLGRGPASSGFRVLACMWLLVNQSTLRRATC